MKITIELSEAEVKFIRSSCILRPIKEASRILIEDATYTDDDATEQAHFIAADLEPCGRIMEAIRHKLVSATRSTT